MTCTAAPRAVASAGAAAATAAPDGAERLLQAAAEAGVEVCFANTGARAAQGVAVEVSAVLVPTVRLCTPGMAPTPSSTPMGTAAGTFEHDALCHNTAGKRALCAASALC